MENFWDKLDNLITIKDIIIDRKKDSVHPRYADYIYPHDYGYLKDTVSSDGFGIDVWVGGGNEKRVTAIITTFDALKNEMEVKLLIDCSELEMEEIVRFHNRGDMVAKLIIRE